jgi:hypothetical protein
MTNTRKLKVTPEIAERLRRGEQVPPEEIEAAVKVAEAVLAAGERLADVKDEDRDSSPSSPSAKAPRRSARAASKAKDKKPIPPSKHMAPKAESASDTNEWIPETHIKKSTGRRRQR